MAAHAGHAALSQGPAWSLGDQVLPSGKQLSPATSPLCSPTSKDTDEALILYLQKEKVLRAHKHQLGSEGRWAGVGTVATDQYARARDPHFPEGHFAWHVGEKLAESPAGVLCSPLMPTLQEHLLWLI